MVYGARCQQSKKERNPFVRQESRRKKTICVICKEPITKAQRPAVRMQPGKESHMECFAKRERGASKPN